MKSLQQGQLPGWICQCQVGIQGFGAVPRGVWINLLQERVSVEQLSTGTTTDPHGTAAGDGLSNVVLIPWQAQVPVCGVQLWSPSPAWIIPCCVCRTQERVWGTCAGGEVALQELQ